jgi:hypothetical protein
MTPECDCCLRQMDRMWVYRHRGFCCLISGDRQAFEAGWWAFCVYCHALFAQREIDALVARVITLHPLVVQVDAERVYRILTDVVCGEPVFWTQGEEWSERRFPCPPRELEIKL